MAADRVSLPVATASGPPGKALDLNVPIGHPADGPGFQISNSPLWLLSKFGFSGTTSTSAIGEIKSDSKIALPRRSFDIITGGRSA
jgi:hypothetical protein